MEHLPRTRVSSARRDEIDSAVAGEGAFEPLESRRARRETLSGDRLVGIGNVHPVHGPHGSLRLALAGHVLRLSRHRDHLKSAAACEHSGSVGDEAIEARFVVPLVLGLVNDPGRRIHGHRLVHEAPHRAQRHGVHRTRRVHRDLEDVPVGFLEA